jgi:phosphate transport system substrate-binding protein
MGSFSSDVSDEASASDATAAASTELLIAGSTTVQPVSELLAEAYMKEHSGIKVTVQGGGSGAGITSAELDIIDIGAASKPVDTTTEHPDLQVHQIGGSAVVVIGGTNVAGNTTMTELFNMYDNCTDGTVDITISSGNITEGGSTPVTLYQRSEASGTEETFAKYFDGTDFESAKDMDESEALGAVGNAGVLAAVEGNADSIGFVDYGFAASSDVVNIIGVDGFNDVTKSNIEKALAGDDTAYQTELTRPLNYLTNGNPSTVEQSFINFAMSPAATEYFEEVGYFSIIDFS